MYKKRDMIEDNKIRLSESLHLQIIIEEDISKWKIEDMIRKGIYVRYLNIIELKNTEIKRM